MRFLVVGAGALGGYFGGRLLAAGGDVTFLLRPGRAAQIARNGLVIRSGAGDLTLPSPPRVLAEDIGAPYDVVIVGCEAYDLAQTMESFAPAVGPDTAILPVLNGMRHLDQLAARFGGDKVLGGYCMISATLDAEGTVVHFGDMHGLSFGERYNLPDADYATHGGCFPINVAGAGIVGCVTISGLPQRDDHNLVVETLCLVTGRDYASLRLAPAS